MKNNSAENYLDQLLNSMSYEDEMAKTEVIEPEMKSPMDSFVEELFGEAPSHETRKAKDEEAFLREFEQDLLKDEIPHFVDDFAQELEAVSAKRETERTSTDASIDDMISHMNAYSGDIEPMVDESGEYEGLLPEEPKPPVRPSREEQEQAAAIKSLDQAVDAFDGAMENQPATEMEALADLPMTEDGELDLSGMGNSDLMDLLAEDEGLSDLGDMLSGDGTENLADGEDTIGSFAESEMEARMSEVSLEDADGESGGKKKKRKKKEKKEKKNRKDKSEGFFAKLSKVVFGEDEPEKQEIPIDLAISEGMDISQLSDENQQILRELEAAGEGEQAPKGKKEKPEKKKKEKKKKEPKPKKEKVKKPPKPKKEKKPKEKVVDNTPPLPKKPVIAIFIMVGSLFGLVLVGTNLLGYQASIAQAKELYRQESYVEAYEQLGGCEIKEKDLPLYLRLETLAPVSSEYNTYLIFSNSGRHDMALDALVCAYGRYSENQKRAEEYQCMAELENIGGKVIKRLLEEYDMTGEEALEMYEAKNRKQYTVLMHSKLQELGLE